MKVYTEEVTKFQAVVQQGLWHFVIGTGSKDRCDRLVKQFTLALEYHDAALAQSVEHGTCNAGVTGSIPVGGSKLGDGKMIPCDHPELHHRWLCGCVREISKSTSWGQSSTAMFDSRVG